MTDTYAPGATPEDILRRQRFAQLLMQQGSEYSPVGHPLAAVARALQGALGGYMEGKAERENKTQADAYNNDSSAMYGAVPSPTPSVAPPPTSAPQPSPQPILGAIEHQESGGNPYAVSSAGAQGNMQVMPATAKDPGFGVKPAQYATGKYDPNNQGDIAENKRTGADYYNAMLERYNGDVDAALVAYNAGPGRADKWVASGKRSYIPPETRNYVASIKAKLQTADAGAVLGQGGSEALQGGQSDNLATPDPQVEAARRVLQNPRARPADKAYAAKFLKDKMEGPKPLSAEGKLAADEKAGLVPKGTADAKANKDSPTGAAQAEMDKKFAQDANTWATGGFAETESGLTALDHVIATLEPKKGEYAENISGPLPGYFVKNAQTHPDTITAGLGAYMYPGAIDASEQHKRAVAASLKPILGSRPAESVINQIIDATYDPRLPPEMNVHRLKILRANIAAQAKAKQAAATYFRGHGTLKGYAGIVPDENNIAELVTPPPEDGAPAAPGQSQLPATGRGPQTTKSGVSWSVGP